jgi:serine/threonine-protein kinase HipA
MARFILANQREQREQDVDRLFRRILACILLGNNDAHAKNFGLLYTGNGFRLAPFYDIVAAALYDRFKDGSLALKIGAGANPRGLASLGPKHLSTLATSFELSENALTLAVGDLKRRLPAALRAIGQSPIGSAELKQKLETFMRKQWNGTFDLIGKR